jgi:hypothetical protein
MVLHAHRTEHVPGEERRRAEVGNSMKFVVEGRVVGTAVR